MRKTITFAAVALVVTSALSAAYAAQFWQAYCNTEKKELGSWSNQEKVAKINKEQHERNNPSHDVVVNSK